MKKEPTKSGKKMALTERQIEILKLVVEGKSNKETAKLMGISAKTVDAHRAKIMERLEIHTLAGLVKYAVREGITSLEG